MRAGDHACTLAAAEWQGSTWPPRGGADMRLCLVCADMRLCLVCAARRVLRWGGACRPPRARSHLLRSCLREWTSTTAWQQVRALPWVYEEQRHDRVPHGAARQ
jgi:hypothetical protein